MKRYISLTIVFLFVCSALGSSVMAIDSSKSDSYSHKVFVEAGTASFCGPCANAASEMKSLYASGEYDFEYVALVTDKNDYAAVRADELGVFSVPDYYFDGGFDNYVGSSNLPEGHTTTLDEAGQRSVADIDISLVVSYFEEEQSLFTIRLDVTNNEASAYSGYLRGFVTEKVSRWSTSSGEKYTHAMIGDFAFDEEIIIAAGQTKSFSTEWDADFYGVGDLSPSNTLVMVAIYDAGGAVGLVDESESITPQITSNHAPAIPSAPQGPSEGYVQSSIEFSSSSVDEDGNDIYYLFDWGDGSDSGWLGPFSSGQSASGSHIWSDAGQYSLKVKAKDSLGEQSGWSDLSSVMINENAAPNRPTVSGPAQGKFGVEYTYNLSAIDPDGDDVYFVIDWGDGSEVESAVVSSGQVVQISHSWSEESDFTIQAKAVDIWDAESDWASLVVSMPYSSNSPVFERLLDLFWCLFENYPDFGCLWDLVLA